MARRHAIRALGRMVAPDALTLLVRLAENQDWRIRYDAVGALSSYRSALADLVLAERRKAETNPHVAARLAE